MKVTQIHSILNDVMPEILGNETIVNEDLSNIVDLGKNIIDSDSVDNYVKKLVNRIGKVVFTTKLYKGGVPSVVMDSWEFGSILQKVSTGLPKATESDSWKLENGKDYSPDIFYQPEVSAKFFNNKVTFEIPISFTELQVKESFDSINQLNGFLTMIETSVQNSMTMKLDSLVMRTINNMIGETLATLMTKDKTLDLTKGNVKAVNLLDLYNSEKETKLTVEESIYDEEFIKFATYMISIYKDRISKMSTLFNIGGEVRFTPSDDLHVVLLSDFAKSSDVYLASTTYHDEKVTLPNYETVPYWQGSGKEYTFKDVSSIDVKTSTGATIKASGIIGVMFDKDCVGVANLDQRVTTNYNPKAEFYTNFYKADSGYYNDLNENFVVFYVA